MKNKFKKIGGIIFLSCVVFVNTQAQDDRLTREMTLEREYDPTIQDANKVNRLPEVREPEVVRRTIEYSPFTIPANPDKEIIILPSGEIMTAIPHNKRRGYFNFGGGMFMNLNGDLGYHFLNDERDKLNFYFSHRSTNGNVEYLKEHLAFYQVEQAQKAVLNDNIAVLDFKHHFDKATLRLGGNFGYTLFNYYGLPFASYTPLYSSVMMPIDSLTDRTTNQGNQTINAYAGIRSKEDTRIGYLLDFEFLRFTQKYGLAKEFEGIRENKYTVQAGLSAIIGDGSRRAGLAGKLNFFNSTYPTFFQTSTPLWEKDYVEVTVTPYYQLSGDNWKARLGANLMMITGDSTKYFISPNVSLEAEVADKTVFYVNAGGEIQSNDPYALSRQNRYFNNAYLVTPSYTWLDASLGIRTGVIPGVWFDLFAGYKITENDLFFVPDVVNLLQVLDGISSSMPPSQRISFRNYYAAYQPDVSLFRAGATLKYKYRNMVDFSVKGVYNNWTFSAGDGMKPGNYNEVKPYGRPAIEVNADLTVKPIEPLSLSLGYYLGAERYSMIHTVHYADLSSTMPEIKENQITLKDINDLSFTASWNFNETLGAWLKLNNLLFQKQELFYGYPVQGFSVMAGINLNF